MPCEVVVEVGDGAVGRAAGVAEGACLEGPFRGQDELLRERHDGPGAEGVGPGRGRQEIGRFRRLQNGIGVDLRLAESAGVIEGQGPLRLLGQEPGHLVDDGQILVRRFRGVGEGGQRVTLRQAGVDAQGVEVVGPGAVAGRAVGDDEAFAEIDVLAPAGHGEGHASRDRPLDVEVVEEDLVPVEGRGLGGQVDAELVGDLAQDLEVLDRFPAQAERRPVAGVGGGFVRGVVQVDGVVPGLRSGSARRR